MQIDIGFGDVIVPRPIMIEYPTLLEFPAPVLTAYPKETLVAEKLEALTALGLLNSRLKDYYDVALLSRIFSFEGQLLVDAIRATFRHRGTTVEAEPVGLTDAFYSEPSRTIQWRAFLRRSRLSAAGTELNAFGEEIRRFAAPVLVQRHLIRRLVQRGLRAARGTRWPHECNPWARVYGVCMGRRATVGFNCPVLDTVTANP